MRDEKGRWLKGSSGNPSGKPKKTLTYYLETALKIKGKREIGKVIASTISTGIWQVGELQGQKLDYEHWLELVQWVFDRIDGKPPTSSSLALEMPQGAIHPAFVEVKPPE